MARAKEESPPARVTVRMTGAVNGSPAGAVVELERLEAVARYVRGLAEFVDYTPAPSEVKEQARVVFEELEAARGWMGEGDWARIPVRRRAYERLLSVLDGAPRLGGDAA